MNPRSLYLLLTATLLLACLATPAKAGPTAGTLDAGPPDPPPTRRVEGAFGVDAQVSEQLETRGTADFFIWLRERADLGTAYDIDDQDTRRAYVYHALSGTAERSQAGIRAYLDRRGLGYEPFWINNAILVRGGDLAVVEAMRARGDVYRIRGVYTRMYIPDPEQLAIVTPAGGEMQADTLWNINIVSAPQVWSQLGITGDGVTVANIDTGVRYTHEALVNSYRGNLGGGTYEHNYNWYPPTDEARGACTGAATAPCDWHGHGSHTMGTMIGGDGDGPFAHDIGVAPGAQWIACMGCDDPPNNCSEAALIACAQWMLAPTDLDGANPDPSRAPDVVNNSWGGDVGEDPWYHTYVEAWNAANIIPVFSAGNKGYPCGTLTSPGNYDNVIGVGGTDSQDRNYTSTSRGPGSGTGVFPVQKPDVAAPGESVSSSTAGSNTSYYTLSGTSMAAPHVSGLVALMRQVDPTISREEIWDILTSTADTGLTIKNGTWCGAGPAFPNYVFGYGRINALAAVQETIQRPPPDLSLAKVASSAVVEAGSLLTYTIVVENQGGYASGLAVSDTLPADTLFAWAGSGGTQAEDEVVWSDLSLPGGYDLALSLGVTVTCVPSGTEIVNADYQALADRMAAPVAGPPLTVVAQQHDLVAGFTFPQPVVRNHPVTLANASQYAATYRWDLGDGTTSTAANPTHTYTGLGAHTVTLTATTLCQSNVTSQELVVHDYALSLAPPSASGSAPPGRTVTYTLRLTNTGTLADSFTLFLGSHAWPTGLSTATLGPLEPGADATFEVYVTVPAGALAGDGDAVLVHATSVGDPRTPEASDASLLSTTARVSCLPLSGPELVFAPAAPRVEQTVTLTGTVAAGSLPITYAWDFGSGQVAGGPVMTHTFAATGTYTVTLVMSNACSSEVTARANISVGLTYQQYLPLLFRRE